MIKSKKLVGWILLGIGLALIFWTLYTTYTIFAGKAKAPQIFKTQEATETPSSGVSGQPLTNEQAQEQAQQEMRQLVQEQLREMVPPEFMSKILNMISWSILAGILIFGGSRIAFIGIRLGKSSV